MGGPVLYTKVFRVMGGEGTLRFVHAGGPESAERVARRAIGEADRIEIKFSRYREESVVSRINRDAGRTPVAVDAETAFLVSAALELAEETGGAFDPTSGVLRRAWDFRTGRVPAPAEIEAILPLVDRRQISIREGTVFLRRPGMEIDLGGLGKEYAADRIAEVLRAEGIASAIVNLGGDVRTIGARGDGRPWRIGIRDPRHREAVAFSVRLMGEGGVATSGDYERSFEAGGIRYHHLLDARTGWPARGLASVTAVAATAFRAGLAATAAFLLGPERAAAHLASIGVEGAAIAEDGTLLATPGMSRLSDLPGSIHAEYPGI